MNILLLAAGKGRRFTDAGYPHKPLISINGYQMWEAVLRNFLGQFFWPGKTNVYVATKKEYNIVSDYYKIINLRGEQQGAAASAFAAIFESGMDLNDSLIIMNCDQFVEYNGIGLKEEFYGFFHDGGLLHFYEPNKERKWGRSILNKWYDDRFSPIQHIVEKEPVSDHAHCGYYYWKKTSEFMKYADILFKNDTKINGEFFLSPIYNLMIEDGKDIGFFDVDEFHGIGDPEDLEKYLRINKCN